MDILEMKNTITEMKTSVDDLSGKMEETEKNQWTGR